MADVDLVAVEDFSYATRRLKAGDSFTVSERMAKVLVGIKKADYPRVIGKVPAPSRRIAQKVAGAAPSTRRSTGSRRRTRKPVTPTE